MVVKSSQIDLVIQMQGESGTLGITWWDYSDDKWTFLISKITKLKKNISAESTTYIKTSK